RPHVLTGAAEDRVEQLAHRVDVAGDPLLAPDSFGRWKRSRRRQPRVGGDAALALTGELVELGGRYVAVAGARDVSRNALGEDPVDHATIRSRSLSVSAERAAMTGELGVASSGAASGSGHRGKLT